MFSFFFCFFFTAMSVLQKKFGIANHFDNTTIAGKSCSAGERSKAPDISESTFEKPPTLEKHHTSRLDC